MSDDGTYFSCDYNFNDGEYFTFMKGAYTVYCSTGNVLTASNGAIDDGSGANSYGNDSDCDWQISVTGADSITLGFTSFITHTGVSTGDTLYIYDGADAGDALLATLYGDLTSSLPTVTSTGATVFMHFVSDGANRAAGWSADYYAWFVSGDSVKTTNSGTIVDGSGAEDYGNRTSATWLINPSCAGPIIIDFSAFVTADANDTLNIYDGVDNTGRLLGSYYGDLTSSLPQDTATSGMIYITFNTDNSGAAAGWSATYSSSSLTSGTGSPLAGYGPGGMDTNLALWMKADTLVFSDRSGYDVGSTLSTSGGAVNSWGDISQARSNDATTANGIGAPTWYDDPAYNINFNPVLRFDGSVGLDFYDDYLFLEGNGAEMIAVVQPDAASTGTQRFVIDFGNFNNSGFGMGYSSDYIDYYGAHATGGGVDAYNHSQSSLPAYAWGEFDFNTNVSDLYLNGETVGSISSEYLDDLACIELQAAPTHEVNAGPLTIGRQSKSDSLTSNNRAFVGNIAEVIIYDRDIKGSTYPRDIGKIRTYLALKYGITPWNVVSSIFDYFSSDETRIWDAVSNPQFRNDVAGIGRDDASRLNQKQSKSINSGTILTIGLGDIAATNSANGNEFTTDKSFLVWGRKISTNNLFETSFEGSANTRINKYWRIEESGTVGTVKLRIPNTLTTLQSDEDLYLVISSDETFTLSDDTVRLTDDGSYFTGTYDFSVGESFFSYFIGAFESHCTTGNTVTAANGTIEDGSGLGTDYGHNSEL